MVIFMEQRWDRRDDIDAPDVVAASPSTAWRASRGHRHLPREQHLRSLIKSINVEAVAPAAVEW
jgi:hypothetical protein